MSAQPKTKEENPSNFYEYEKVDLHTKKVNVKDLVARLKEEEKLEKKNNIILSAAAVSAVTVLGIILTL